MRHPAAFMLIMIISCSSCTAKLWDRDVYQETIHSIYIDESGESFVVLGEEFHYIFQSNDELINILKASSSIILHPTFRSFSLSDDNSVSGSFDLYAYRNELFFEGIEKLKSLGFDSNPYHNHETLSYKNVSIKGVRYKGNPDLDFGRNLRKPYKVNIKLPNSSSAAELAGKAFITPVTVAADAVIGIVGVVLIAINL